MGTMRGDYELVIGNKNLSSWSLRPWLALKAFGIPFAETQIWLRRPESKADILRHSPSGKVPALKVGDLVIWDSLAIIEYLAERHSELPIWPEDAAARAIARSVSAEMHSGFAALREELPMDFVNLRGFPPASERTLADIRRIVSLWKDCLARFGGDGGFLFGTFCAADAMFAPVASRFITYQVDLARFGDDGAAACYRDAVMAMPEMRAWGEAAKLER